MAYQVPVQLKDTRFVLFHCKTFGPDDSRRVPGLLQFHELPDDVKGEMIGRANANFWRVRNIMSPDRMMIAYRSEDVQF